MMKEATTNYQYLMLCNITHLAKLVPVSGTHMGLYNYLVAGGVVDSQVCQCWNLSCLCITPIARLHVPARLF